MPCVYRLKTWAWSLCSDHGKTVSANTDSPGYLLCTLLAWKVLRFLTKIISMFPWKPVLETKHTQTLSYQSLQPPLAHLRTGPRFKILLRIVQVPFIFLFFFFFHPFSQPLFHGQITREACALTLATWTFKSLQGDTGNQSLFIFTKFSALSNLYNKGQEERENQLWSPQSWRVGKSAPKSSELNAQRGEECWQRGRRSPATQRCCNCT